jgi:hypothetical protein
MTIEIWTSLDANPRYVYEKSCTYHGELNVPMPDTTGGKKREIGVKMTFGKTELEVRALNKRTGKPTNAEFVFGLLRVWFRLVSLYMYTYDKEMTILHSRKRVLYILIRF